jgi:hypothetical protein
MAPSEPYPTSEKIQLFVGVFPSGALDVRYAPMGRVPPVQMASPQASRMRLAEVFSGLGLYQEAAFIANEVRENHVFIVPNTPELAEAFKFSKTGNRL